MRLLRKLWSRPTAAADAEEAIDLSPPITPAPETDVYVIGDIHGRIDLAERLLAMIDDDIVRNGSVDPRVVFVGDYIDRGDHSAEVLGLLRNLTETDPQRSICLMGNHESMMLDFLNNPEKSGARWLRNGGLQTLASFRVSASGVGEAATSSAFVELAAALRENLPQGLEGWLSERPLMWNSGSLWVVHAAADPDVPMPDQARRTLLWGHGGFAGTRRTDGQVVVHGHTIVDQPEARGSRIAVDTGAIYTGVLTAAAVRPDGTVRFLAT